MTGSKTLVAYFSASGVTKRVAEEVARAIGADLFEIVPAAPYTAADLNWNDPGSRSSREDHDASIRPAVTLLVGFPIWWGHEPAIVDTFLEQYDLSGKTLIPFATSGGSGVGGAERSLARKYPAVSWQRGALLSTSNAAGWARGAVA